MDKKFKISILIVTVAAILGAVSITAWRVAYAPQLSNQMQASSYSAPVRTAAELLALEFLGSALASSPTRADSEANADRAIATLSQTLQTAISYETAAADFLRLIDIQDLPDEISTVSVLAISEAITEVTVALQYPDTVQQRTIAVERISTDEWVVVDVYSDSDYRLDVPDQNMPVAVADGCYIGGCSSHICSDDPQIMTTCEWRDEYMCFQAATCERQPSGECGWTQTETLLSCIAGASTMDLEVEL